MKERVEKGEEDDDVDRDMPDLIREILKRPRREIVESFNEEETKKYSEFLRELGLSTGNLNYHLLRLQSKGLLKKTGRDYRLTPIGKEAWRRVKRLL